MSKPTARASTVLFDLDGTLLDTAPDLAFALNEVRREQGLGPLSFATIRPSVSLGSAAMIRLGFAIPQDAPPFAALRQRLLDVYRVNIARETRLFEGMEEVLQELDARGLRWGIVTNKPGWLTEPLLAALDLHRRAGCVVSGDTTPTAKPEPEPLLHAAALLGVTPTECVYVGDAERDIEAARRAGMPSLIALYGYISEHETPHQWGAAGAVGRPEEIMRWLTQPQTPAR